MTAVDVRTGQVPQVAASLAVGQDGSRGIYNAAELFTLNTSSASE